MVTLKQLRNFLVLCETLHFSLAARKLNIAPAVLSKEIIKMERQLGFQLFDRSDKRNIVLTDAGEVYLKKVRGLIINLESAADAGRKTAQGEQGTLSVAIAGVSCRFFDLADVCRKFSGLYPEVKFNLREVYTPGQTEELLENRKCDLAIIPVGADFLPFLQERFETRIVGSYCFNYMFPVDHPLAKKEKIRLHDLLDYPLILPSKDFAPVLRKCLDESFIAATGRTPEPAYEADGLVISWRLISAGLGVGIFAGDPSLHKELKSHIIMRQMESDQHIRNVIAWKSENNSKLIRNFLALIPRPEKL